MINIVMGKEKAKSNVIGVARLKEAGKKSYVRRLEKVDLAH